MGIWDYICSWTDSLKRNAPDLTKTGNAFNIQSLKQNLPEEEARQKIAQFTTCLAKNAAIETIKSIPGGDSVRKVVTKSYEEVYRCDGQVKNAKTSKKKKVKKENKVPSVSTLNSTQLFLSWA